MKIFLSDKDLQFVLHSISIYLEKLDFVFKNKKYYTVSDLTISMLEDDYKQLDDLRKRLSLIELDD